MRPGSLPPPLAPLQWRVPLLLFAATVVSILYTGVLYAGAGEAEGPIRWSRGVAYAVPLLAILLTHEFGHFVFARMHRVNASLPMFIPLPVVSLFGTMGAVIIMRDRIRSRNALLDIGASGPLAGIVVAIPVLLYGLSHSEVKPLPLHGDMEGQCLLYYLLKQVALGPIPAGWDVQMSPAAFAGWVGLFVTMLNLLPTGQLDGGHIAYALLGEKQERYGKIVRLLLPVMFLFNLGRFMIPALRSGDWKQGLLGVVSGSTLWIGWFVLLTLMRRISGEEHPPTEPGELSPGRKVIAVASLILFVLIFMPTPWHQY